VRDVFHFVRRLTCTRVSIVDAILVLLILDLIIGIIMIKTMGRFSLLFIRILIEIEIEIERRVLMVVIIALHRFMNCGL